MPYWEEGGVPVQGTDEGAFRCERRDGVLPGSAASWDQPVGEGSAVEGLALGTERLFLDPYVLLARGCIAEVQALQEKEDEGMKDSGQRLVRECQVGEEAATSRPGDHAERVDGE